MAPTTATIRSLLEKTPGNIAAKRSNPGSLFQLGGLEEILAPNVKVEIPGFAVTVTGAEAIKSLSPHPEFPALASIIRLDQPLTSTVTHVVGGGSDDIIVAITSSKATTHSGKPWDHESVLVLHFNNQDQIDSLKAYIDTKSISEHIEASAA
ncbi:hypothetical protein SAMD00023353_1501650 [Rosellinia necatrix]|uniref:Uncharacterized protein n=1 Tax=Rosellinia necatrix TaxID=77044 RepID=A0A1W2TRJ2_ROSNE|nr:hypothetical protein SAMD00023353_1501650 [Rosellinia necatrix]